MWRGVGGFILFSVSYAILGSIVGALFVYLLAARFFSAPADGSMFDYILRILVGIASGFFGVLIGAYVLGAVMKRSYPVRAIGAAFIIWLAANYALHFLFFPENTDFEVYSGLVTSMVACATTWFVFRLPPLSPNSN